MASVLFSHPYRPTLIVDDFVAAMRRLGHSLAAHHVEALPPNPCAALAICLATRTPCQHAWPLAIIADCGVGVRCGYCWMAYQPGACPTCQTRNGEDWLAGILNVCRRCGEVTVGDYIGWIRIVPDDLLQLVTPEQTEALRRVRSTLVSAGASA